MKILLAVLAFVITGSAYAAGLPRPPAAKKIPFRLKKHGDVRIDDYCWLRERQNPQVLAYLQAENDYTAKMLAPQAAFGEKLFSEMKARVKQKDSSAPYRLRGYYYYARYEEGKEYPIHCRKKGSLAAQEEVLLDVNELAAGHEYFDVAGPYPSTDSNLIAYAADDKGNRVYTVYFKDLRTGRLLGDVIPGTGGNMAWANDNITLFYAKADPQTLRWDRIMRHTLGGGRDTEVYVEKDDTFEVSVARSLTGKYIMLDSASTLSSEWRILEADNPAGGFRLFAARRPGVEYSILHGGDRFYVLTNDGAKNFRFCQTPEDRTSAENWEDVVPHRADTFIEDAVAFERYLALQEKRGGLTLLHVFDRTSGKDSYINFDEPAYTALIGNNPEYDSGTLRFEYESLARPPSVYDYDMAAGSRELKKRKEVPGYRPEDYTVERVFAVAPDGVKVPVSLVYRNGFKKDGTAPLFITGYGAYGINYDPDFYSARVSLLDRGFVFAIAHIRGGSEMGRQWYEDGRQLEKKNTFTDFTAATQYLVNEKYCSPRRVYAEGGSAGGLLMGAVANMRPELYNGIIARVPFVDVLTTMLDASLPLTTGEYDQWGNPNDQKFYEYIRTYSPYDNVKPQAYPNMLVTAGLNDSQVQYWEPAKWVAKLRAMNTGNSLILLKTELGAGHHGKSGRFEQLRTTVFQYNFIFKLEGITR